MHKLKRNCFSIIKYGILFSFSLITIIPFIWIIISSTNSTLDIMRGRISFGTEFVNNFSKLMTEHIGFIDALKNSAIIAVVTTILALLVSSMAGYGFEIFRTKWRDRLFTILLITMMVPFSTLMIPLYRMFAGFANITYLQWLTIDTIPAIIIPVISTAFLMFFFRQNTKSFPRDIIEAARIEGLNELSIFFFIYVPIMRPTYAAAAIITFMTSWNNYFWPLVAIQSQGKRTVPLVLSFLGSAHTVDYGLLMVGITIATLPIAVIFFIMQKQFVSGMLGSVK